MTTVVHDPVPYRMLRSGRARPVRMSRRRVVRPGEPGGPPVILLCGGGGQRMGELTSAVPKPMLTVGDRPLLWHIMRGLASYGSTEFLVALGHLAPVVKEFFLAYPARGGDVTVRLGRHPTVRPHARPAEEGWRVSLLDTGDGAGTGTRLRVVADRVPRWPVVVAYGDVLADVDVDALLRFHRAHGRLATVTTAPPPPRFGHVVLGVDQQVLRFEEKQPYPAQRPVSIGYFVLEQAAVRRYIPADRDVMFEEDPVRALAADGQLMACRHEGFWQPVDTPKELAVVRDQWQADRAPWKVWRP